jgi:uncharacterized glyoxalase superfamily protein PhnB
MTHKDTPDSSKVAENWSKAILYARMTIGETDIMASAVPPERFQLMRSAYRSLTVGSSEEAKRTHTLLAEGGETFMRKKPFSPRASASSATNSALPG